MHIKAPAGSDFIEKSEAFESSAVISPIIGYTFNDDNFQTEASVLNSTILEYLPQLSNGMADSEQETLVLLDEFIQELKASGIEEVIKANQEQLDAYINNK